MRKYDIDHYPDFKMRRRMAMMMGDPEALCKYSNIHRLSRPLSFIRWFIKYTLHVVSCKSVICFIKLLFLIFSNG